jgi:ubiquinone/menaquinone biosynthesis C-methylase UbiE
MDTKEDCFDVTDFKKWSGKRVLDIGCGIGTDSINFVKNGADLTIVEFSDKSLDVCKKKFEVFDVKATFIKADVNKLEEVLTPYKFDLIYLFGIIHQNPNPDNVFKKISKYMETIENQ